MTPCQVASSRTDRLFGQVEISPLEQLVRHSRMLLDVQFGRNSKHAKPGSPEARIGKDKLGFKVQLENNAQEQLIFKHAISTVVSGRPSGQCSSSRSR